MSDVGSLYLLVDKHKRIRQPDAKRDQIGLFLFSEKYPYVFR